MKSLKSLSTSFANSRTFKASVLVATVFATNAAMALDDAAVATAQTEAATSVNLAVVGLIAIVAVITGVTAVIMLLKKI